MGGPNDFVGPPTQRSPAKNKNKINKIMGKSWVCGTR